MSTGAELIAAERQRQIEVEGWTIAHDAAHPDGELVDAAACYLLPRLAHAYWPWTQKWWKPTPGNRVRELVKAGALIAAEIDRLSAGPVPTEDVTPRRQQPLDERCIDACCDLGKDHAGDHFDADDGQRWTNLSDPAAVPEGKPEQ